jgi:hypothetical protein
MPTHRTPESVVLRGLQVCEAAVAEDLQGVDNA